MLMYLIETIVELYTFKLILLRRDGSIQSKHLRLGRAVQQGQARSDIQKQYYISLEAFRVQIDSKFRQQRSSLVLFPASSPVLSPMQSPIYQP